MQNTFSQSGNDSKWFLKKSFFKIGKWHPRPPRDPPPFMANAILNFHFDYLTTSLRDIAYMYIRMKFNANSFLTGSLKNGWKWQAFPLTLPQVVLMLLPDPQLRFWSFGPCWGCLTTAISEYSWVQFIAKGQTYTFTVVLGCQRSHSKVVVWK